MADLHLHSRYSLATSPRLNIATLAEGAIQKGIDLLAAPDFTHPTWRKEMRAELEPVGDGVFRRKSGSVTGNPSQTQGDLFSQRAGTNGGSASAVDPAFILVTEISCIWNQSGRSRRVHVLLMVPSFEAADRIGDRLAEHQNLESDGRPMMKMSARDLYALALEIDERCGLIPAHVWTPWYGVYGSKSGFDSLEECFGEFTDRVPAIETGLSSNPQMNWAVSDIGERSIVSFSDAHSPGTMGRELTVLDAAPDYESVRTALFENRVVETIEFHPEHGKYHLNGHRKCGVRLEPGETPADGRCSVCNRPLTLGVLHRVSELADREPVRTKLENGLVIGDSPDTRPFRQLVPLRELVAQGLSAGVATKKVSRLSASLVEEHGNELAVLTTVPRVDLAATAGEEMADLIVAVRDGEVEVVAGYDGVYGTVSARSGVSGGSPAHV